MAIVFDHGIQVDCRRQVETTNKQILNALKKKLDEFKGKWAYMVPAILWSNRTKKKRGNWEGPYVISKTESVRSTTRRVGEGHWT